MTKIESGKSVTRETVATHRGRPLIAELHPGYLLLRPKGTKSGAVMIEYGQVYESALIRDAKLAVAGKRGGR